MRLRGLVYLNGGLLLLTSVFGAVLSSTKVFAESAGASVTVPTACNLNSTLDVPHTATINNGTFVDNIGTTTFKVFCNDDNGFSIYAVGYSGDILGGTQMLATIGGNLSPTDDIPTGLATSGDASSWAMKLTAVPGTYAPTILSDADGSYGDHHVVPTTYAKVATFASNTDFTAGSSFKTSYRAYVTKTQPAGTYTGKVKYTLVHPASEVPLSPVATQAGKIGYVPNASGVVDTMGDQSASSNAEVMLWPSNFKRDGYGFAGWNTAYDYSGTTYGPMETITTPDLSTEGLTLYAVWVKYAGDMQNWQGCGSMTNGQVTALKDTRDGNTYAVAKLADGKCWMIENLRLGGANPITLTPADSNVTTNFTLSATTDPATTAWCTTYDSACYDQSMLSSNNTTNPISNMTSATLSSDVSTGIYSLGNYYNWYSATAGTGTYSTSSNNTSVASSICPAGWRLPIGGNNQNKTDSDYYQLGTAIVGAEPANSTSTQPYYTGNPEGANASKLLRTYPNNFLYSGYVYGSSFTYRGSDGGYWSSTANSSNSAYLLLFYSSNVRPGTYYGSKYGGFSVRCVR